MKLRLYSFNFINIKLNDRVIIKPGKPFSLLFYLHKIMNVQINYFIHYPVSVKKKPEKNCEQNRHFLNCAK